MVIVPFTYVQISIIVIILTISLSFIIYKITFVLVFIQVLFESISISPSIIKAPSVYITWLNESTDPIELIIWPETFKSSITRTYMNSSPFSYWLSLFIFDYLANVKPYGFVLNEFDLSLMIAI